MYIYSVYIYICISNGLRALPPAPHCHLLLAGLLARWSAARGVIQNSVLRLCFSHKKCLENKTECWPFFGFFPARFLGGSIIESSDHSQFCTLPPMFAPKIVRKIRTECRPFFGFPPLPKTVILNAWRVLLGTFWHPGAPFC